MTEVRLSTSRREAEEAEAQRYAKAIRYRGVRAQEFWGEYNWKIVERWSRTALQRVKQRAWRIVELDESEAKP